MPQLRFLNLQGSPFCPKSKHTATIDGVGDVVSPMHICLLQLWHSLTCVVAHDLETHRRAQDDTSHWVYTGGCSWLGQKHLLQ